jgi:hypothetical protein
MLAAFIADAGGHDLALALATLPTVGRNWRL